MDRGQSAFNDRVVLHTLLRNRLRNSLGFCGVLRGMVTTNAELEAIKHIEDCLREAKLTFETEFLEACDTHEKVLF